MIEMAASEHNPFPVEAVSTFGSVGISCDDLEYMKKIKGLLEQYLSKYPVESERFGGAIGIRGDHGSGKTHALAALAEALRAKKSIRGTVIYGKCDSNQFFDLCYQLMAQFDRPLLIELIQLALLNLARAKVRSAKITEGLAERLQTVGGLQQLQNEHNLDLEQLHQQLLTELQSGTCSLELARVLLAIPDASVGVDAHRWLTGNEIEDMATLGITHLARGATQEGGVDMATRALTSLLAIATLCRVAEVPLLVLVDQLEVLMRVQEQAHFQTLGSLLKKFIEELGLQSAMVFIAGTPKAWDELMPDVSARFLQRDQIVVGSLSQDETALLFDAYTAHFADRTSLSSLNLTRLYQLSGGSPREILRIGHYLFEKIGSDFRRAAPADMVVSARSAGTIDERARRAMEIADASLPRLGMGMKFVPGMTVDGSSVDRIILNQDGDVLIALILLKASDALSEIDFARRVQKVRKYSGEHWGKASLVIVAVGYASDDVNDIIRASGQLILFNEATFEHELRSCMLGLMQQAKATPTATPDSRLLERITELSARLEELERRRGEEAQRIQQHFSSAAEELAAPTTATQQLNMRRETLDTLEALGNALDHGNSMLERQLMRSVLVTNEAYLHNPVLDNLGDIYLETLALKGIDEQSTGLRWMLLHGMRDGLRHQSDQRAWLSTWRHYVAVMLMLMLILFGFGVLSIYAIDTSPMVLYLPMVLAFGLTCRFVYVQLLARRQQRRLQQRLMALRRSVEQRSATPDIRAN